MKTIVHIATLGIALSLMGCPARSLFPLFMDKDISFNPGLVGAWSNNEAAETYLFQKGEGKNFAVIVTNKDGDTIQYRVQLGRLGKSWFLDSYPTEKPKSYHMISTHLISKIWYGGDTLKFASLEGDSLKKMVESGKLNIPISVVEDGIILTASTKELQQIVLKLADDDRYFPEPEILSRMK